ncbi:transketolase [bacterium]|nr:transketolase [bacterium]
MAAQSFSWTEQDVVSVNAIRMLSAEMVQKANSGHPGMPMGFALPAHLLWTRFLKFNPDNPFWPARDRFILSCGHGSALLYSLLHLAGYDLSLDDLKDFRQLGSRTPGHPEFGVTPGVETTTGPLGQGVGNAVGMAMAQRYTRESLGHTEQFNPLEHYVYVIASDGDLQEGVSAEASSLAGRQKLGRLIVLYDDNSISIDGGTDLAWSEDVCKRYEAYGWHTQAVDGDDPEAVYYAIQRAQMEIDAPSLIKVTTHIGYGSPNKQDSSSSHGAPLGDDELKLTREKLGWTLEPFAVPDEVYEVYAEAADHGRSAHEAWLKKLDDWMEGLSGRRELWDHLVGGGNRDYVTEKMPTEFDLDTPVATRGASGKALNFIAERDPGVVGGCADLAGSVKTMVKGDPFLPEIKGGRNIFFGIREHGMGAIANGMALYGSLRPYTGTFLIFSDYMRPSIRLAGLMNLPVIFVFSHDSIGVGEDGPTHQPVEHYAALRAIPNLWVVRPGDAAEMMYGWKLAYDRTDGPTAILSTRQKLPIIDRSTFASVENMARGGYVLADAEGGKPELILLATGSEVGLVMQAWERLSADGVKVRVVSMPCWEAFEEQDDEYKQSVLPPDVTKRLSVEVGVSQGWERYVGTAGACISMERFGASAPGAKLFEKFGFTVDAVVDKARGLLKK